MNDLFDPPGPPNRPQKIPQTHVEVEVIYRTQVGACLPFTVLPKHYAGKKVRLVIVGEADE